MKPALTLLAPTLLIFAFAAETMPPPPGGDRKPPQEAITACEDLTEQSSCSVETPRGDTLEGKCVQMQNDTTLACMPDRPPHMNQREN
ncbi:MAG TPA: hypothetical protein ENK72_01595 [Epsilonproteobacteria bacterium]|nr:hypothetical protein [Campylobacterota bacterium]